MKLKDFIRESLVEIVQGITEAQKSTKELGAVIVPTDLRFGQEAQEKVIRSNVYKEWNLLQYVEFDVALTVSQNTSTSGGIGIDMAIVDLGSKGETKKQNETVHRLKFTIPVVFPGNPKS